MLLIKNSTNEPIKEMTVPLGKYFKEIILSPLFRGTEMNIRLNRLIFEILLFTKIFHPGIKF